MADGDYWGGLLDKAKEIGAGLLSPDAMLQRAQESIGLLNPATMVRGVAQQAAQSPTEGLQTALSQTPVGPALDLIKSAGTMGGALGSGDYYAAGGATLPLVMAAAGVMPGVGREERMAVGGTVGRNVPRVTFKGMEPKDFSPQDWHDFGKAYGVDNLGPADEAAWRKNLGTVTTNSGREITVPGGIDSKDPFTYYDLLHLKAQGIDPNDLAPGVHQQIHDRMVSAMQWQPGQLEPHNIYNQLALSLLSPGQRLTSNEMAVQRVMAKGPEDLERIANMIPGRWQDLPSAKERVAKGGLSEQLRSEFGVQGAKKGGLGVSGTLDYTALPELAQKIRENPEFFRFNPDDPRYAGMNDAEKWSAFVTKMGNTVRGFSAKTGSFGTVWQDPANAAISAMDRHMANRFRTEMFDSPAERAAFENDLMRRFNAKYPDNQVNRFEDMLDKPGGTDLFHTRALDYLGRHPSAVTRTGFFGGEYNPAIPSYLQKLDWPGGKEPTKMEFIGKPYQRALGVNQAAAQEAGQGLFSNQWMLWDRQRQRLEPHEIMFPGLDQLPRMPVEQMRDVSAAHKSARYLSARGKVKPVDNPSRLGYFSLAPVAVAGGGLLASPEGDQSSR